MTKIALALLAKLARDPRVQKKLKEAHRELYLRSKIREEDRHA